MKSKVKLAIMIAGALGLLMMMSVPVLAQGWKGLSESHGFGGQGWNAGYWNGGNLVPGDYTKNGIAWGAVGTRDAGVGIGFGYGGGGVGVQAPGRSPIRLGW